MHEALADPEKAAGELFETFYAKVCRTAEMAEKGRRYRKYGHGQDGGHHGRQIQCNQNEEEERNNTKTEDDDFESVACGVFEADRVHFVYDLESETQDHDEPVLAFDSSDRLFTQSQGSNNEEPDDFNLKSGEDGVRDFFIRNNVVIQRINAVSYNQGSSQSEVLSKNT